MDMDVDMDVSYSVSVFVIRPAHPTSPPPSYFGTRNVSSHIVLIQNADNYATPISGLLGE